MENIISYYYNFVLEDLEISERDGKYYFCVSNVKYAFIEVDRSVEEIEQLYSLARVSNRYYEIILNIENKVLTIVENRPHALLKLNEKNMKTNLLIQEPQQPSLSIFDKLLRNNWVDLWSNKIDYFEYQLSHVEIKYPIIRDSIHYFIGLAEVAIAYVNETLTVVSPSEVDGLTICRKRLDSDGFEYFNPLNFVIDHKARDISEYLKIMFIKDEYTVEEIDNFIKQLNFSELGYRLLMGRMFYPSLYFDMYEDVVNSKIEEERLRIILKRVKEYECFLGNIYKSILSKGKIPRVDFL